MSTEEDEIPTLRELRLEYSKAVEASRQAEEAYTARPLPAYRKHLALRHAMRTRQLEELEAGRRFLALLDDEDPACTVCGCTQYDPCTADEDDLLYTTCWWVHKPGERPLCSACSGKAVAT